MKKLIKIKFTIDDLEFDYEDVQDMLIDDLSNLDVDVEVEVEDLED